MDLNSSVVVYPFPCGRVYLLFPCGRAYLLSPLSSPTTRVLSSDVLGVVTEVCVVSESPLLRP